MLCELVDGPHATAVPSTAQLNTTHRRRAGRAAGFSLLELMVVLVIIGLVAGLVTVNVRSRMSTARLNVAKAEIGRLADVVHEFYLHRGRYPTSDEGLEVLTQPLPETGDALITNVPVDPWGRRYDYNSPAAGHPFEIICYGADGQEGGSGADQDIISWKLGERQSDEL